MKKTLPAALATLLATVLGPAPFATATADSSLIGFIYGEDHGRDLRRHDASQLKFLDLHRLTAAHVASRRADAERPSLENFVGAIVCESTPGLKGAKRNKIIKKALEISSTIPVRNEAAISCFEVFADLPLISRLLNTPNFGVMFLEHDLKLAGRDGLKGIVRDVPDELAAAACSDAIDTSAVSEEFVAVLQDLFRPGEKARSRDSRSTLSNFMLTPPPLSQNPRPSNSSSTGSTTSREASGRRPSRLLVPPLPRATQASASSPSRATQLAGSRCPTSGSLPSRRQ